MRRLQSLMQHLAANRHTAAALLRDENGVTAIEYGLIAALIAIAAVAVMSTVGTSLSNTFTTIASDL